LFYFKYICIITFYYGIDILSNGTFEYSTIKQNRMKRL